MVENTKLRRPYFFLSQARKRSLRENSDLIIESSQLTLFAKLLLSYFSAPCSIDEPALLSPGGMVYLSELPRMEYNFWQRLT